MLPEQKQNRENFIPSPDQNPVENVQPIRTYKSDVAEFIKREGKTLADIAIAESARRSDVLKKENDVPEKRKKVLYIITTVIILVGISIFIFWLVLKPKQNSVPITTSGEVLPSMFVSGIKEKLVSIGNQNEAEALNIINVALKESNPFLILKITSEKKSGESILLTVKDFLEKIGIYPPGNLIRSLTSDFAIGSIGGKARFLVLKNNYYGGAFAGMLGWENTIVKDLRDILDLPTIKNSNITTATVGTTTFLSQIRPSQFIDDIVANRDARIFKNGSGTTILLYLFSDNETIIITGSESVAKIVSEKLLRTKVK